MADHFLQVHVLEEGGVLFRYVDPLLDHLVQHLGLFAGLAADTHGVVHRDDGDDCGHRKDCRTEALAPGRGDDHGADGRAVGAGHTAVSPHPLQLKLAQQDKIDEGLQYLRDEPRQKRHRQDRIQVQNIADQLHVMLSFFLFVQLRRTSSSLASCSRKALFSPNSARRDAQVCSFSLRASSIAPSVP